MYRRFLSLLVSGLIAVTYADSATQTDWSGGSGVLGPVQVWDKSFLHSASIDWLRLSGLLRLATQTTDHTIAQSSKGIIALHSADIDGDGDPDVIGSGLRSIRFWENVGSIGTSWNEDTLDNIIVTSLSSADLDGDGDTDILGACEEANRIYWWQNSEGSGTEWIRREICSYYEVSEVYTADIDGDGDADAIGAGELGIAWWENADGSGITWIYHSVASGFKQARSLFSDDIDGDGDMDVLAAAADDIAWWENIGGTGVDWVSHNVTGSCGTARSASTTDLDNDGDQDILAVSFSGDSVSWWENEDGSGSIWIVHPIAILSSIRTVFPADVDCDGDIDVICAGMFPRTTSWWENTAASGIEWVRHDIADQSAITVIPADLNCDGIMDVVVSTYTSNQVNWHNLHAYQSGWLRSSILYTGFSPAWDRIDWSADTPSGTSVAFQVRASDNYTEMGGWSEDLTSPGSLSAVIEDGDGYFQYMVMLQTDDVRVTPVLYDVSVSWDSIGTVARPPQTGFCLYPFAPNPSTGSTAIRFSLPWPASVDISVFNLSGRLICAARGNDYSAGYHNVLLEDISAGIYFCRMISGDFMATQRFVVIE